MGIDPHRNHTERLVFLDETHASHIAGEVIDLGDPADRLARVIRAAQIQDELLRLGMNLPPGIEGLDAGSAHVTIPPTSPQPPVPVHRSPLRHGRQLAANRTLAEAHPACGQRLKRARPVSSRTMAWRSSSRAVT